MSGHKKRARPASPQRLAVPITDITAIVERTRAVLSTEEHAALRAAVDTLALVQAELQTKNASLARLRKMIFGARTEKTRAVLGENAGEDRHAPDTEAAGSETTSPEGTPPKPKAPGHGRNAVSAYTGAEQVTVAHPDLHSGDACPHCLEGTLYRQNEPAQLVRITGMAPLSATVYACDRLRCHLCGEVTTAPAPEGVGPEKYGSIRLSPRYRLDNQAGLMGVAA